MTYKNLLLLILIFTLNIFHTQSQGFLKTAGSEIVDENGTPYLLKGMGLGGWMLQEGYMLQTAGFANAQYQLKEKITEVIGEEATEEFYEAWLANHVRKIDIDSLKSWGFNSVRLPMHYNLFTLPIEEEPIQGEHTWLEKGFTLTDSLISWCKQNQMYVILDLHAAPGGQGRDQGISDYDPTKPSLWESKANRDKTVALWKKLAERYVNEPWVGGYDLINETNWEMDGNVLLKELYLEITDSIRAVDNNHIIFIEGNWFANDFTNLTPPWDDNIVYSPHKYWSINDQASIQWVLDIRETYNVPLYFGETGENSNVWFRDAIKLFEEYNIGWAWWPMKKIESIAGPLSAKKNTGYQNLLDYWNGTGPLPTAESAKAALMQMTENLKLENCVYQKDVIDAMFRQVASNTAIPFRTQKIPGIVYPTDFDMGTQGVAYFDTEVANYQVSTGSYTSWNNGWVYRNDGVDIEITEDNVNTNGYNIGWLGKGEWLQYDIEVEENGIYDVQVRVAANDSEGAFHLGIGLADVSNRISVPGSGGWQNWQTVNVSNVVLTTEDKKLRFYVDEAGYNLGSLTFTKSAETASVPTNYLSARTIDNQTIQLVLNKPLENPIPASPANFMIRVNGNLVSITDAVLDENNTRIVHFSINHEIRSDDVITISYSGTQIQAVDGTMLSPFSLKPVQNSVAIVHALPGRVEAEDYFYQLGIQLEQTTDVGGGQNVGYLDVGDYLDYYVSVPQRGIYRVNYRTAALNETGQVRMELVDEGGNASPLHTVSFQSTGGWQTWRNTTAEVVLPEGRQQIRIVITQPLFNINWFEFDFVTARDQEINSGNIYVYPNPNQGVFHLKSSELKAPVSKFEVLNTLGQVQYQKVQYTSLLDEAIDLSWAADGLYFIKVYFTNGAFATKRLIKEGN